MLKCSRRRQDKEILYFTSYIFPMWPMHSIYDIIEVQCNYLPVIHLKPIITLTNLLVVVVSHFCN